MHKRDYNYYLLTYLLKGDLAVNNEEKPTERQGPPQLIPKFLGKKVTMRLLSGGQPITGIIKAHNPYEILVQTAKMEMIIPKRAIAVVEIAGY
jgi:sRNA-binding regulator protein Hfq